VLLRNALRLDPPAPPPAVRAPCATYLLDSLRRQRPLLHRSGHRREVLGARGADEDGAHAAGVGREAREGVEIGGDSERARPVAGLGDVGLGGTGRESPRGVAERALGEQAETGRERSVELALVDDTDRALDGAEAAARDRPGERLVLAG